MEINFVWEIIHPALKLFQTVTKNTKLFLNDSLSEEWCFEESKLDENVTYK